MSNLQIEEFTKTPKKHQKPNHQKTPSNWPFFVKNAPPSGSWALPEPRLSCVSTAQPAAGHSWSAGQVTISAKGTWRPTNTNIDQRGFSWWMIYLKIWYCKWCFFVGLMVSVQKPVKHQINSNHDLFEVLPSWWFIMIYLGARRNTKPRPPFSLFSLVRWHWNSTMLHETQGPIMFFVLNKLSRMWIEDSQINKSHPRQMWCSGETNRFRFIQV